MACWIRGALAALASLTWAHQLRAAETIEAMAAGGVVRHISEAIGLIQKKLTLIGGRGDFVASIDEVVTTLSSGRGAAAMVETFAWTIGLLAVALALEATPRSLVLRLRARLGGGDRAWSGPLLGCALGLDAVAAGLFAPILALLYAAVIQDEPPARLMAIAAGIAVLLGRACLIAVRWVFVDRSNPARGYAAAILLTIAYGWLVATFLETAGIREGAHIAFCIASSLLVSVELSAAIWRTRVAAQARLLQLGDRLSLILSPAWTNLAMISVGVAWCVWVVCFLTVGERTFAALATLVGLGGLLLSGWRDWRGGVATIAGAVALSLLWSRDAEDLLFTWTAFTVAATLLGGGMIWRAVDVAFRRLSSPVQSAGDESQGGQPRSRLETIAPLVRIVLLAAIGMAVLMITLSSLGVDTNPLLAGAGVIGLAIGFGAQTLIRDIITGVFFLVEDAFRIGEYVDVGSNKRGEVEAISPRSIRLRHHRGAIHRVPFSEIRTLTNHSRDWAIDKILLQVEYGADVEKLRKLVKAIGEELSNDPVFGPSLLGPLKSQGITAFGESGLQIRLKFTSRPQDLFLVRREAMKRLHIGFREAGIDFAPARRTIAIETEAAPSPGSNARVD